MKAVLIAMWRLFHGLVFYPLMVGLFIWLFVKGVHWGFGLAVIVAILVLDPMWRIIATNVWTNIRKP